MGHLSRALRVAEVVTCSSVARAKLWSRYSRQRPERESHTGGRSKSSVCPEDQDVS